MTRAWILTLLLVGLVAAVTLVSSSERYAQDAANAAEEASSLEQTVEAGQDRPAELPDPPEETAAIGGDDGGPIRRGIGTGSQVDSASSETIEQQGFPQLLPWPPPRASRRLRLDRDLLLAELDAAPQIGDVARYLSAELRARDYDQIGFLGVPGNGFALLTGLEQIDRNAEPLAGSARWISEISVERGFSLRAFLDALLSAPVGNFRVFVFVFTDQQFQENTEQPVSTEILEGWSERSVLDLPDTLSAQAVRGNHQLTVLVYEFFKTENAAPATLRTPSLWNMRQHLAFPGLERFVN
ncbi:MAG: hypothetical protein AAFX07_12855 [Pseudomonadota bacterium]